MTDETPRFAHKIKIPKPWIAAKDHAGIDGLQAFAARLEGYRKQVQAEAQAKPRLTLAARRKP